MRGSLVWLVLPLLACGPDPGPAHDPEQVYAEAIAFATELERLDAAPIMSAHLQGTAIVSIWANADAAPLFRTLEPMQLESSEAFPEGSLLVKETFDAEGNPVDLLSVMAKFEPGYNPDGNDWFFAAITRDGEVIDGLAGGGAAVEFCRDCHEQNGANTDLVIGLMPGQLN